MRARTFVVLISIPIVVTCAGHGGGRDDGPHHPASVEPAWTVLFPHPERHFAPVAFGGAGEVEFLDGTIEIGRGEPLTGIRCEEPVPTTDYEIEVEAARRLGNDFFCALTFPVAGSHATIVLGGWGGSLVGISCLDGEDAANNESKSFHRFERDVFYSLRVRVTHDRVTATLTDPRSSESGQTIVDVALAGRTLSLRTEVERCAPLGIATYSTHATIRRLAIRNLP